MRRSIATGYQIPRRLQACRTCCSAIFMAVMLPPPGWLAAPSKAREAVSSLESPDCSPAAMVWRLSATLSLGAALNAWWTAAQIAWAAAVGGDVDGGVAVGLDEQLATPTARINTRITPGASLTNRRTRTATVFHENDAMDLVTHPFRKVQGGDNFAELLREAEDVSVSGWDFSWLDGRATEELPTWNYSRLAVDRVSVATSVLDFQTGSGELLAGVSRRGAIRSSTGSGHGVMAPNVCSRNAVLFSKDGADEEVNSLPVMSRPPKSASHASWRPGLAGVITRSCDALVTGIASNLAEQSTRARGTCEHKHAVCGG